MTVRFSDLNTKKSKIEFIREKVGTDRAWAIRGLLRIYANQTEDEKVVPDARHNNGIGFTGSDAEILTSFAQQVERGRNLTEKQMNIVFRKMPRYSRQLMESAA